MSSPGTQWPVLAAGVAALLPTLPGFTVAPTSETDVMVYTGAPGSGDHTIGFFAVGWTGDGEVAGAGVQTPSGDGYFDSETGTLSCYLFYGAGDSEEADVASDTTAAFALFDTLKDHTRTHRTLGVLPVGSSVSLGFEVIRGVSEDWGAGVHLLITFSYSVPIT